MHGWDWYVFWTDGPIRRRIYETMKRVIYFVEHLFEEEEHIMKPMEQRLKELQQCAQVQLSDGNWDWDAYMFGLANGLILAEHIMADRDGEPAFRSAPDQWRKDRYEEISPLEETSVCTNSSLCSSGLPTP